MEKEFVTYEQALALKELGFDEPCFIYYKNDQLSDVLELVKNSEMKNVNNEVNDYISAPLYQQAFRWFRDKYKLLHNITEYNKDGSLIIQIYEDKFEVYNFMTSFDITEYQEAESACLDKLIEIVKNK